MQISLVLKAASRLSTKMLAYQIKRAIRNRFCLIFPSLYEHHINSKASKVPSLGASSKVLVELAEKVSTFYVNEYSNQVERASKGIIKLFEKEIDFGGVESMRWNHRIESEGDFQLWRQKLSHMGFVCPMLIGGKEAHFRAISAILSNYRDYAKFNIPDCFSSYWFTYSVSHRVLAIMSGYIIANSQRPLPDALKRQIEEFLRWNIAFILVNIEHELKNNHVERNLAAICLYCNCVDSVPLKLASKINTDVKDYITSCILDDGMNSDRSAMYQGLTMMALTVFSKTAFLSEETCKIAEEMLIKASRAWSVMTHPDGEISLFNDSWFGEVPKVESVVNAPSLAPIETLKEAGYVRMHYGDFFLLFDAGEIGPTWNPGHGHADFLAIELDVAEVRFIVDPGTYQYSTGKRRQFERSAQSHNGPCWKNVAPVEYHGCFKVGNMAKGKLCSASGDDLTAQATGSLALPQGKVKREIFASHEGVFFTDTWDKGADTPMVRLVVQGEWIIKSKTDYRVTFQYGNKQASVILDLGTIKKVEACQWARHYLRSEDATAIYMEPKSDGANIQRLTWEII